MEAAVSLSPKHIFGCKGDTKGPVHHLDEQRVIYSAGHNIVVYNRDERRMQILPGLEGTWGISCIAQCPKRKYLAVAEKAERAIIFIYDGCKKLGKRPLVTSDCQSHEYVSMAFAPRQESKFLITMGGAPDWVLLFWQWDKQKILALIEIKGGATINQVGFHGQDYLNGVIVTGDNVFRWYKIAENQFKLQSSGLQKKEPHLSSNFLCHSWLNDGRLVVGTDNGEILVFDQNCDYRAFLSCGKDSWRVLSILPYSKGFLVGGDEGTVLSFEKRGEDTRFQYFRDERTFQVTGQLAASVTGLSLSSSEQSLVLALSNSQVYCASFTTEKEAPVPLSDLFHSSGITGMDVCVRKPLVVTCGKDSSVRIWNYKENLLEVLEYFTEEPYSAAFHPNGMHIIVGFSEKLRMMNIFAGAINTFKEIRIKTCREIRFAHGGHLFAATNNQMIQVFNFYTGENPPHMHFKGHRSKVLSLHWNEDDTVLYSTGLDGAVHEWNLTAKGASGVPLFAKKNVKFSSVLAINEPQALYVAGNDREITEITAGGFQRALETGSVVGHLALPHSDKKVLFAGISEQDRPGSVRVYKFDPFDGEYTEYQAHNQPVERLRVSLDDGYLFTAGADGCLVVFEILDKQYRRDRDAYGLPYAEEILVTKSEIEELNSEIQNLIAERREQETKNKFDFDMEVQGKQVEIDELKAQIQEEAANEKARYEALLEKKSEMEHLYEEEIVALQKLSELEIASLENSFKLKFKKEVARYNELSAERDFRAREYAETIERYKSKHNKDLDDTKAAYKAKLEEINRRITESNEDSVRIQEMHEQLRNRLEDDNERQIYELREENIRQIEEKKQECDEASKELTEAKINEEEKKKEKHVKERGVKVEEDNLKKQREEIKKTSDESNTLDKEIKIRTKTINDKKKRIKDLSKKSQELAKFKFVLDYKIRELKRETGPKREEIARLKEQTGEMEKEIKHLYNINEQVGNLVEKLRLRQEGMQTEISNQKATLKDNLVKIQSYKDGIYDTVQYIQEEKKLKEAVLKLYNNFVVNETEAKGVDSDKGYVRQCNHLESTISGLRKKLKRKHQVHNQYLNRILNQNVELIKEINGLKKENKFLESLQGQLAVLRQKGAKTLTSEDTLKRELDIQRDELSTLKRRLSELEGSPQ